MADSKPRQPRIEPHPLVEALVPDPAQAPQRTTKLFGYPGRSPNANETRLWLDLDLTSYVDVPDEAILHSRTLPDDGGTIVWVRADAELQYASVSSHAAQADFLSGSITATHLGGAAGFPLPPGGPIPPTLAGCPPPPTLELCPTHVGPCLSFGSPACPTAGPTIFICCQPSLVPGHCPTAPSYCCPPPPTVFPHLCPTHPPICTPVTIHCPSVVVVCPSHQILCHPSVLTVTCPSHQVFCPTSPAVCRPVSVFLVCHTRICPSVAIPCQTTPGCPQVSLGCPIGDPGGGAGPILG